MNEKTKVKIAYADAIIERLWVEGLLTAKERSEVMANCHEKLQEGKC